jgi:hypothetical protein
MSNQPAEKVVVPAKPGKPRAAKPKADPAKKPAAKKTVAKLKAAKKLSPAEERAARLAKEAGEIASGAGLKSAYLPQDAAAFLAEFKVARDGQTVTLSRKGQKEPGEFKLPALKRFIAAGGEPEVSKVFRALCRDSRLYGRKAACFAAAALAQEEAA